MNKIDYIKPKIFDDSLIISGVTKSNIRNYPPYGFTISAAKIADPYTLRDNRHILSRQLGVIDSGMIFQKQVHEDIIRKVGLGSDSSIESDGLYTSEKGVLLNISIADCVAILIHDKHKNIVCGVHSGWKGTSLNIAGKAIKLLSCNYGSIPSDLLVYISPCASGALYEVGSEFEKIFPRSYTKTSNDKGLFDNKKEIAFQLLESGVPSENIESEAICTISNPDFHSYRRDEDLSGRMSAFIGIKI